MQVSSVSFIILGNGKPFLKFVLQDIGTKVAQYFLLENAFVSNTICIKKIFLQLVTFSFPFQNLDFWLSGPTRFLLTVFVIYSALYHKHSFITFSAIGENSNLREINLALCDGITSFGISKLTNGCKEYVLLISKSNLFRSQLYLLILLIISQNLYYPILKQHIKIEA